MRGTVHSRYYEPLFNEPSDIINNFWLFSGSTSIEVMLKNSRCNEQLDTMNGLACIWSLHNSESLLYSFRVNVWIRNYSEIISCGLY